MTSFAAIYPELPFNNVLHLISSLLLHFFYIIVILDKYYHKSENNSGEIFMFNRWLVVLGAIFVQVSLGAVYGWSLFNQPLADKYGWEKDDIVITFSITIATFALFTIFAGRLQDRIGSRWVATGGGILLGTGLMLASTADSLYELYLYYGIISGAGIGTAYVCPLAASVKWFPEKRGLISGIAVAGFGAGGLIFKPIIANLIETVGVSETFFYLGIIYLVLVVGGAQLLREPPENYAVSNNLANKNEVQFTPKEMLSTYQFYLLLFMFLFGAISGLLVISQAVDIGVSLANLDINKAANAVMAIALFNASGRILWGMVSDKIGRKITFSIMYSITSIIMFYMSFGYLNYLLFMISVSLIGFTFGGFLALFPSKTADYYGVKHLGINYGLMYQAYGVSALLGPIIAAYFSLKDSFLVLAILGILGIVMSFFLKPPNKTKYI